MRPTTVFATSAYTYLLDRILEVPGVAGRLQAGALERKTFPDGERYLRIRDDVRGHHTVVLGGTDNDTHTLELFDLGCGLVNEGVHSLTLVIPYFGCSTMERSSRPGEVVTAKTRARLLSSIPLAGSGTRVFLVDLHTEGVSHYFEGAVRPHHLHARAEVCALIRDFGATDFVLASTDAGRAKWVETLANELGVNASFVFKRRLSADQTEVTALSGDVSGRNVVLYDDMIRTGSSLLSAARAYRDAGARNVWAVCTHAVLPGDALERLLASGALDGIAATDSHPQSLAAAARGLRIRTLAPLIADSVLSQM